MGDLVFLHPFQLLEYQGDHDYGSVQERAVYYTPNCEEVEGAYCFGVVRASVTLFDACNISLTVLARVLKFHIGVHYGKIVDQYFFFLVRVISLCGVMPR